MFKQNKHNEQDKQLMHELESAIEAAEEVTV